MFEIIDHALSIQVVHHRTKEIPVQCSRKSQIFCFTRYTGYSDDFFKGYDLYSCDDSDDIEMPREHAAKEYGHHDKGPYCSRDEGLLLLLVIVWLVRILVLPLL